MAKLNVQEGDSVSLTDAPDGGLRLTPVTAGREQFAEQMHAAADIILNGHRFEASEVAATLQALAPAARDPDEARYTAWWEANSQRA